MLPPFVQDVLAPYRRWRLICMRRRHTLVAVMPASGSLSSPLAAFCRRRGIGDGR
jgi:hypothetical protein